MKRETAMQRIEFDLATLESYVDSAAILNHLTPLVILEDISGGLLERVYGLKLVNLNSSKTNYPGVDLIDEEQKIAYQVSVSHSSKKIRETIHAILKSDLKLRVHKVVIFFFRRRVSKKLSPRLTSLIRENSLDVEILDISQLLRAIQRLKTSAIDELANYLGEEMPPRFKPNLNSIPEPPSFFAGRASEISDLTKRRPDNGGILLTGLRGMGGVGKSTLGFYLAKVWAKDFPDGTLFLDGRGLSKSPPSPTELLTQALRVLYPSIQPPEDQTSLRSAYLGLLKNQKVLVFLDNARDAAQASPLIPPNGNGLIVTSRRNFILHDRPAYNVGNLNETESIQLLRALYNALTDIHAQSIARLCAGLPLALRIAGSQLALDAAERGGTADVDGYIAALKWSRLKRLDEDAVDLDAQPITDSIRLSEQELTEVEQDGWRSLGIFSGPFEEDAAIAIAEISTNTIKILIRRSLLERDGSQLRLHDLAVDYVRARTESARREKLMLSHARYFLRICISASVQFISGGASAILGVEAIERVFPHVDAAVRWLGSVPIGVAKKKLLGGFADALFYYAQSRLPSEKVIEWFDIPENLGAFDGSHPSDGWALNALASAYEDLSGYHRAENLYERALSIARSHSDAEAEADALGNLGSLYLNTARTDEAIETIVRSLALSQSIGYRHSASRDLGNAGNAYMHKGDMHRALMYFKQALEMEIVTGDRRGECISLNWIAEAYSALDEHQKTVEYLLKSLYIAIELRDRHLRLSTMLDLAAAYDALGSLSSAFEIWNSALKVAQETEDADSERRCWSHIGEYYYEKRKFSRALNCYENARSISRKTGDRESEAIDLNDIGATCDELGKSKLALERFLESATICREISDDLGFATALFNAAELLHRTGDSSDLAKALAQMKEAESIFLKLNDPTAVEARELIDEWTRDDLQPN